MLGVEHTVIGDVELEADGRGGWVVVVSVRATRRQGCRCPVCRARCPGYDRGEGPARWRGLDLGTTKVYLEARPGRVRCPVHGVITAWVPWARHDARFTLAFEDQVAWMTAHMSASTVGEVMRVSWRTVGVITARVVAQARGKVDRLTGLRRIGIDEKSYRKGHKYLMIVVDHATGRVVWAREGRNKQIVGEFFADLGQQRATALTHVSCDGATWIHDVVTEAAPKAVVCLDPFHVVAWATEAIDEVRRRIVRDLKAAGRTEDATALKGSRWAVLKNPERLTGAQRTTLASVKQTNGPLYRAYLIKEQLRAVFAVKGPRGRALLAGVISWASRSRIPEMVELSRTLRRFRDLIANTLDSGVTNALAEATNTHIQALITRARGYHTPEALIAMIELTRGGLCPDLPGRP